MRHEDIDRSFRIKSPPPMWMPITFGSVLILALAVVVMWLERNSG